MLISACGLVCNECHFFRKECAGCYNVNGAPFWAKDITQNGVCPLYDCSINEKSYRNCGDCKELPCVMFSDLKDPNVTEEEHKKVIRKRVSMLRSGKN
jgi:hypothetical protein